MGSSRSKTLPLKCTAMKVQKSGESSVASVTPPPENESANPAMNKFDHLKDIVDGLPDVRQKKISNLKKAIADGNYRVDGDALAQRIVNDAARDAAHRGKVGLERWPPAEE